MKVQQEINKIIKEKEIDDFAQIFSFSNEMISSYLPLFDFKGKTFFTLGSSCDQAINASFAGCEDITIYDICPFTQIYFYLKYASILCLSREELLNFLFEWRRNRDDLKVREYKRDTFNRIKDVLKELDYESYALWEPLFRDMDSNGINALFEENVVPLSYVIRDNEYLYDDEKYEQTRRKMAETYFKFVTGDIGKQDVEGHFDVMWLSNLLEYYGLGAKPELDYGHYYESTKQIMKNVRNCLNPGGRAMLNYFREEGMNVRIPQGMEGHKRLIKRIYLPNRDGTRSNKSVLIYDKKA